MKNRHSLALLTIVTCLTLRQDIAASSAKTLKKISSADLRALLQKLEMVEKAYEESTQKLYSEFLSTIPTEAPKKNFVKAGISKLVAALATGYYLGMHHKTIENTFEEQVRPAITLSSESLPTKEEAEAFAGKFARKSVEYFKKTLKDVALKNPEQEKPETEKKSDKESQNS